MARNGARALWFAIALCLLAIGFFGFSLILQFRGQAHIDRVATTTHSALCAFRGDLQQRYDNGVRFLEDHPNGIDGISRADIERPLMNQKATLKSLSNLKCG